MDVSELVPSDSPVRADHVQHYYERLCALWGLQPRDPPYNPCALAVSLERDHLREQRASDYLVTPKIDGVRFLLMLTLSPTDECMAVMVGRDLSMYEVHVWAPHSFFERGTLVDGELAWARGEARMAYHVFDAMCIEGHAQYRKMLVERLQIISLTFTMFTNHIDAVERYLATGDEHHIAFVSEECKVVATHSNNWGLSFHPKQMADMSLWARKVRQGAPAWNNDFPTDGVVLTPRNTPVYVGTHRTMFKWKPAECQTVDFLFRDGALWLGTRDGGLEAAKSLRGHALTCGTVQIDAGVYECRVSRGRCRGIAVEPVRRRRDKRHPNTVATAAGVVASLIDDITERDLLDWCDESGGGGASAEQ